MFVAPRVRAVTTMATYQMTEEGPLRTLSTIDRFVIENPQYAYLRIQELNLRCMYLPDQDHAAVFAELERELPAVDFTYTAGTMLSEFFSTVIARECNGVDFDTVVELADLLLRNPRYVNDRLYNQFHHKLLAGIARQQGDDAAALEHLQRAIGFGPSSELNSMTVTMLAGAGEHDARQAATQSCVGFEMTERYQFAREQSGVEPTGDYLGMTPQGNRGIAWQPQVILT